jgi:hypothetical protein
MSKRKLSQDEAYSSPRTNLGREAEKKTGHIWFQTFRDGAMTSDGNLEDFQLVQYHATVRIPNPFLGGNLEI